MTNITDRPAGSPAAEVAALDERIATYRFDRLDDARRHALAIGGRLEDDADDETGFWTVYGDPQREARRVLRETSNAVLIRQHSRATHALHEADRKVRATAGTPQHADAVTRAADCRAIRDRITAECLRRMGGE